MSVDFTKIKTFKLNFDNCTNYHEVGEIIKEIESSKKHEFLSILETAKKYYNKLKVAAVYYDGEIKLCDLDDLQVLINNFPEDWK